jgi:hypothetical protein
MALPLRFDRGESDATLSNRIGEGPGVRLGEVSKFLRGFDGPVLVTADGGFQRFIALSHGLVKIFLKSSEHFPNFLRLAEVSHGVLDCAMIFDEEQRL